MQSDIVQRLLRVKNRYDDGCSEDGKLHNPDGPEAAAEITRLTEALRAAEEREKGVRDDAGRYRWLRDHSCPPHNFYISVPDEFAGQRYAPGEVDAYIDAARAALKGPSHDA